MHAKLFIELLIIQVETYVWLIIGILPCLEEK